MSAAAGTTPAERRRGILLMLGAGLCWSTGGILVRNTDVANSWEVVMWRSLFMAIFVAALLAASHGPAQALVRLHAVGRRGVMVGLFFATMFACFLLALTRTTVANTLVLTSVSPFFAAIAGRLFLGERVLPSTWIAMTAALAGIVVMFADSLAHGGALGNLIALLVPLAYACNLVILRRSHAGPKSVDMIPAVFLGGVFSVILTLPLAWPLSASAHDIGVLAVMGVVQLGLGCVLMTRASRDLPAAEIGLLSLSETILGPLWVWWGVGETPSAMALAGGAVVIAALAANDLLGRMKNRLPAS